MKLRLNIDALLFPDGYELLSASKHDDLVKAKSLLSATPTLVYYSSIFGGQTAWHHAALHGSAHVLEELVSFVKSNPEKLSKYYLSRVGCFQPTDLTFPGDEVARALNRENNRHQTPLMLAAAASHPQCTRVLLQAGADLQARDAGLRTALHYAAFSGCSSSCSLLIQALQDAAATHPRPAHYVARFVDRRTICGFTALHYAVYHNHIECAQQLLFAGASLLARCTWSGAVENIWCDPQCTPLHLAARTANAPMVKLLLQALVARCGSTQVPHSLDPRAQRDRSSRLPYHYTLLARPHSPLVHLLHPATPLEESFTPEELADMLVAPAPSLAHMAAAAHRAHLRSQLQGLLPAANTAGAGGKEPEQAAAGAGAGAGAGGEPQRCVCKGQGAGCQCQKEAGCQCNGADGAPSDASSFASDASGGSSSGSSSGNAMSRSSSSSSIAAMPADTHAQQQQWQQWQRLEGQGGCDTPPADSSSSCAAAAAAAPASSSSTAGQQLTEGLGEIEVEVERQGKEKAACAKPAPTAAAAAVAADNAAGVADGQCGVCWSRSIAVELGSCGHALCGSCSLKICDTEGTKVPLCPFCRGTIRSFSPLPPATPAT